MSTDNLIYSYTRKEAIEDGVLVDVSKTAARHGIRFPFAMTAKAWAILVEPSEINSMGAADRLNDLLTYIRAGIGHVHGNRWRLSYRGHDLDLVVGPGDDEKPVLTLLFPGED